MPFIRRGNLDKDTEETCEKSGDDGGRHRSNAPSSQGTPSIADHNQKLKIHKEGFFPRACILIYTRRDSLGFSFLIPYNKTINF